MVTELHPLTKPCAACGQIDPENADHSGSHYDGADCVRSLLSALARANTEVESLRSALAVVLDDVRDLLVHYAHEDRSASNRQDALDAAVVHLRRDYQQWGPAQDGRP